MLNRRQLIASAAGLATAAAITPTRAQEAAQLQINSTRYIATNADTGAIFAQRNARERVAIASLTKVFTAVQAMAMAPLDFEITTTEDDLQNADATVMGFAAGMTYTLEELIYGMMLPSGNDAAHAISRSLGGEEGDSAEEATARFMEKVNQRVLDMGLKDTHLINPDGWGVPNHYSTAADMAAFMAYACQDDFLLNVMGTRSYTTERGSTLTNTNKALWDAPSVLGGKTGYDWDSGWCLVQIAERDNTRIIAVTLDGIAPDDWYNDNLVLLDYGFDQQQALGRGEHEGEFVAWENPEPAIFMQAGPSQASITGESSDGEQVVDRQETEQAAVPEHEDVPGGISGLTVPRSSTLLAGIGGAAMAAGMAFSRWQSHGGDATAATIAPSLGAIGTSTRRMLPGLPALPKRPAAEPTVHPFRSDLPSDDNGAHRDLDDSEHDDFILETAPDGEQTRKDATAATKPFARDDHEPA